MSAEERWVEEGGESKEMSRCYVLVEPRDSAPSQAQQDFCNGGCVRTLGAACVSINVVRLSLGGTMLAETASCYNKIPWTYGTNIANWIGLM